MAKKRPTNREPEESQRTKTKGAGSGESRKTRPQVKATPERKADSGKGKQS